LTASLTACERKSVSPPIRPDRLSDSGRLFPIPLTLGLSHHPTVPDWIRIENVGPQVSPFPTIIISPYIIRNTDQFYHVYRVREGKYPIILGAIRQIPCNNSETEGPVMQVTVGHRHVVSGVCVASRPALCAYLSSVFDIAQTERVKGLEQPASLFAIKAGCTEPRFQKTWAHVLRARP
jgi:hypothetical protein